MQQLQALPTVREVLHHDWARKFFAHRPADSLLEEHLSRDYVWPGTCLDYLATLREGLRSSILVARTPRRRKGGPHLSMWHGAEEIREETFYGLFGHRFQRISSSSFSLILDRLRYFFIADPEADPVYVIPLPEFARLGVSVGVLEEVLGAKVVLPAEGLYANNAYVPSLRVYLNYDGSRYRQSTRKIFYDQNGNPVPVELVARDVLHRLGYEVVPPAIFHRLFYALTDRPPSNFHGTSWPGEFLGGRLSPLFVAQRARERILALRDRGVLPGLVAALEAVGQRPPYRDIVRPDGALPLVSRFFTRKRFASFVEAVGENRMIKILDGLARGYQVVSADWFAYMDGTNRVFPCEVKARGDHLRPYQKESILFGQRDGLLDYRLLEVLHNAPEEA